MKLKLLFYFSTLIFIGACSNKFASDGLIYDGITKAKLTPEQYHKLYPTAVPTTQDPDYIFVERLVDKDTTETKVVEEKVEVPIQVPITEENPNHPHHGQWLRNKATSYMYEGEYCSSYRMIEGDEENPWEKVCDQTLFGNLWSSSNVKTFLTNKSLCEAAPVDDEGKYTAWIGDKCILMSNGEIYN